MKRVLFMLAMLLPTAAAFAQLNVTNVVSNSNGTLENTTDDYITFTMNPVAPVAYYVDPYTYTVTATQGGLPVTVTLSDGSPATNLRYAGYLQHFRLSGGTAGKGNVVITVDPNWGSFPNTTGTLTDPGTTVLNPCAVSGTVTYRYQSPTGSTDVHDWQAMIPKFNIPGKILTGVSINYSVTGNAVHTAESRSPGTTPASQRVFTDPTITVNGVDNAVGTLTILNTPIQTLGGAVAVPALGAWPGDDMGNPTLPSTLNAMENNFHVLSNNAFSYLDPRLSPQWVTNFAGIAATADDDILVAMGSASTSGTVPVAAASVSAFAGTGNAPVLLSSLTSFSILGGGGNAIVSVGTTVSFEVAITYTFTSTPCFPVSGAVYLDQDGLANGIKNQNKFTGSAAMGLKAVLVDADGIVVDVVAVDASGNYSFPNVAQANGYTVRITTQPTVEIGGVAPVATLGTGSNYAFRGEFNGAGTGNDGSPDGMSAGFAVGAAPVTLIDFAIYDQAGGNPLSANFTNLAAQIVDGHLTINFTTLGETNNSYFEVEASQDGKDFTTIGKLDSKATNGNSTEVLHYGFTTNVSAVLTLGLGILLLGGSCVMSSRKHRVMLSAITVVTFVALLIGCSKQSDTAAAGADLYIRIAQIDKDGAKSYSKVIKVIQK